MEMPPLASERPEKSPLRKTLAFLTVFSVAMGFLEAVVVVYLRQLYYPEGFAFPLKVMTAEAFSLECMREVSTILILSSVGGIVGKNSSERLAYFLYCFGIWDIFYYLWLKVLLNWPPSVLTWDILFLIPVIWVGPVLAPVICALTMIALAGSILYYRENRRSFEIHPLEWTVLVSGAVIIFVTFIWDYAVLIMRGGPVSQVLSSGGGAYAHAVLEHYIPTSFHWYLYLFGQGLLLSLPVMFSLRMKSIR